MDQSVHKKNLMKKESHNFNVSFFLHKIRFSVLVTLPLFFVLDAFNQFWGWIPAGPAVEVFLWLTIAILLLHFVARLVFSADKALLVIVWLAIVYFFFKTIKDWIVVTAGFKLFSSYSNYFILLFSVSLLFLFFLRSLPASANSKLIRYVNLLVFIFCLVELGTGFSNYKHQNPIPFKTGDIQFSTLPDAKYPDVFVLQLDEYAGLNTLEKTFGVNNQKFVDDLKGRSFQVAGNPNSNYNGTPFSVLSLLNMNYLQELSRTEIASAVAYSKSVAAINNNKLMAFFRENGYAVSNHSFFDVEQTVSLDYLFLPIKERLILDKTLGSVLANDLVCSINSNSFHLFINDFPAKIDRYNQEVIKRSHQTIQNEKRPLFMYMHLMAPHGPFLRDSSGQLKNIGKAFSEQNKGFKITSYLEYLAYCNAVSLRMVDSIKAHNPNSIIILLSDHGLRNLKQGDRKNAEFNNFLAVYSPSKQGFKIPDSLCTVNVFRLLLNEYFDQKLPLLENRMINVNMGLRE